MNGTVQSVGDHRLTIYNNSICQSNAVTIVGPWIHPRKVYQVDP